MLNLQSPELEAKIKAHVAAGHYATPEEVVAAAIASLEQSQQFEAGELDALCQVGLDQLDRGEYVDADDVFREIAELQAKAEREGHP